MSKGILKKVLKKGVAYTKCPLCEGKGIVIVDTKASILKRRYKEHCLICDGTGSLPVSNEQV